MSGLLGLEPQADVRQHQPSPWGPRRGDKQPPLGTVTARVSI